MKEFMTKVSDYLNEKWNNPERQEDRLAVVIIGAIVVVVIALLLLVLWGHVSGERERKKAEEAEKAAENALVSITYEEEAAEYMAQNDEQEMLKQEYLANIEYLNSQIKELLSTLTQVEQNMSETIEQYQEENAALTERITQLRTEVNTIVQNLKETQTKLYDLIDIVQIMNEETIPLIREQIAQLRGDMDRVHTDIAALYAKIADLEQEDIKLWAGIGKVEDALQKALNQNMTEVNNQFDILMEQIETVENRIERLTTHTLRYRYDSGENTLYLEPYGE